jgi:hypothetical protein
MHFTNTPAVSSATRKFRDLQYQIEQMLLSFAATV